MERLFQIIAAILAGVAVFFWWRGSSDAMFITTVVASVCFFLSYRFQVKERMEQREREKTALEIKTANEPD